MVKLLKLLKNHKKILGFVHIAQRAMSEYLRTKDVLVLHEAIFALEEIKELL